jgi:hypothetical protein
LDIFFRGSFFLAGLFFDVRRFSLGKRGFSGVAGGTF